MISLQATKHLKHFAGLIFFIGIILVGFLARQAFADHASQYKAGGFAYGSIDDNGDNVAETGIGYISFGCEGDAGNACGATSTDSFPTGYGVRINTNPESSDEGKFYGYAWSSNYGWVSFFGNDVSSCGAEGGLKIPGDVQEFIHSSGSSTVLDGWARVLNYDPNEWDGCIRFAGSDVFGQGSQYQSTLTAESSQSLRLDGWAYGGNIVGWISFDCEYCDVTFSPVEEEGCEEADDPDACGVPPVGSDQPGVALYVGAESTPLANLTSTTSISLAYQGEGSETTIKLAPDAFGSDVYSCVASYTSTFDGQASGWNGEFGQSYMNPLVAGGHPQDGIHFFVDLSDYVGDETYFFKLDCLTVDGDEVVTAFASVTMKLPSASVSITANPGSVAIGGGSLVSWASDYVESDSCSISGEYDLVPEINNEGLNEMNQVYADGIGFTNLGEVESSGSNDIYGLMWPTGFKLTCNDLQGNPVSDVAYIDVGELGCVGDLEEYCDGDTAPIFEEF